MELTVYKIDGEKSSKKINLDDRVFGLKPNPHVVYLDVKLYLANQRQGTHKTKQRAEVNYSTKKIVKQKGSGGARHGSLRSPIFVGGGRAFGPVPRDYGFKLNKKVKQLARKVALSSKAKSDSILVLENISLETPRTKDFLKIANNLQFADKKTLLILGEQNKNVYLSSRNLPKIKVITASTLNTYDIVNAKSIIIQEDAVEKIHQMFGVS